VLGAVYKIITRLQGIHKLIWFNHMNVGVIFYSYLLTDIYKQKELLISHSRSKDATSHKVSVT